MPGKLRIALSAKPGVLGVRVKDSVRTAVDETAQVLRSLGHEVTERDPAYGDMRPPFTPRWLRGIRDDAAAMPDPGQLEARTRSLARLGGVVGERGVRWALRGEPRRAERIGAIFEDHDVLLTATTYAPPPPLDPPGVYHPPALVPDGVDDLTDQEYLSLFKPPRPVPTDLSMKPDLVDEVRGLDARVVTLENRKPGPTNPPARTPSTND